HMSLDILKILAFTPAVVTVSNYIAILVMIPSDMKKEFMRIITTSGVVGLICITILTYLYSATGTAVGIISTEIIIMVRFYLVVKRNKKINSFQLL
ncbi:TPA: flippase, partial [Salmonella enterica subsp. enterica serovar Hvittingfoss]